MPFYLFSRDDGSLCISPDLPRFAPIRFMSGGGGIVLACC